MLTLNLVNSAGQRCRSVGPAPYFRIDRDSLRAGPQDQLVAVHDGGTWDIGGESFLVLELLSPVKIRFQNNGSLPPLEHGPLEQVRIVDGSIRYGQQPDQLLARFDEQSKSWHIYPHQQHSETVILEAG